MSKNDLVMAVRRNYSTNTICPSTATRLSSSCASSNAAGTGACGSQSIRLFLVSEEESTAEWETGGDNAFAPAMGGRPVQGQLSPHTTWEDLEWIRKEWDGPIVLKGVQCADDAKLAMEHSCDGILLSNHGGRQLHTAPSALMTLLEIRTYCPEVLEKLEVFLDGGLRDGNDVLKALCLGATAVGESNKCANM